MKPRYEVEWSDQSIDHLARICHDHFDRLRIITQAADEIDKLLSRYPWRTGESRHAPHVRHFYAAPLGIEFEIIEDDAKVLIYAVWFHVR